MTPILDRIPAGVHRHRSEGNMSPGGSIQPCECRRYTFPSQCPVGAPSGCQGGLVGRQTCSQPHHGTVAPVHGLLLLMDPITALARRRARSPGPRSHLGTLRASRGRGQSRTIGVGIQSTRIEGYRSACEVHPQINPSPSPSCDRTGPEHPTTGSAQNSPAGEMRVRACAHTHTQCCFRQQNL